MRDSQERKKLRRQIKLWRTKLDGWERMLNESEPRKRDGWIARLLARFTRKASPVPARAPRRARSPREKRAR